MVSTSLPDAPSYGVEINGKVYPHHLRRSLAARSVETAITSPEPREKSTADSLVESIWKRLPFADTECVGKHELIDGYGESLRRLQQYHAEFDELMKSLCRTNFSSTHAGPLQKEQLDAETKRRLDAMYRHGDLKPLRVKNVVDAELLAKPAEVVQHQLTASLRQTTRDFVEKLFRTLDRLTDRNVTGVVQWTSGSTCKFHFFTETLEQTWDGSTSHTTSQRFGDTERRETTHRKHGKHIHVRARHEHHLIDATQHEVSDPAVEVPQRIQPLLVSIPAWLRPVVRVVSGKQIREDIVEQERNEDRWLQEEVTHSEVRIRFDPALVIGEIVLTGWSESDLLADRQARNAERNTARLRKHAQANRKWMYLAVAVAMLLEVAAVSFTIAGATRSMAFVMVAASLAVLGLVPTAIAVWLKVGVWEDTSDHSLIEFVWLVGAWMGIMVGIQFLAGGWALGNLGVGLAGIVAFAVGLFALLSSGHARETARDES